MGSSERQHFTQQFSALLERVESYLLEKCWGRSKFVLHVYSLSKTTMYVKNKGGFLKKSKLLYYFRNYASSPSNIHNLWHLCLHSNISLKRSFFIFHLRQSIKNSIPNFLHYFCRFQTHQ